MSIQILLSLHKRWVPKGCNTILFTSSSEWEVEGELWSMRACQDQEWFCNTSDNPPTHLFGQLQFQHAAFFLKNQAPWKKLVLKIVLNDARKNAQKCVTSLDISVWHLQATEAGGGVYVQDWFPKLIDNSQGVLISACLLLFCSSLHASKGSALSHLLFHTKNWISETQGKFCLSPFPLG